MKTKLKRLRENPVLFVRKILHVEPDKWQAEALEALTKRDRIAIRSGHGVGKSALAAWSILWFLFVNDYAKVVCTAPTARQLNDVLWSELAKWLKKSEILSEFFEWQKTRVNFRRSPAEWFATAKTASKPEALQGFHSDNLFFVMDEASGIDDAIYEVVLGALTGKNNKLLMLGNPTKTTGFFKRAFFEDREHFYTMKVSSLDSSRVSDEYCERLIRTYGKDSDVVRVRVLGEFPKAEADGVIPLEWIEAAFMREPTYEGELFIGVDVARFGNDSTVLAARVGNDALPLKVWNKSDLMTTCGRIFNETRELMNRFNKKEATVNVDEVGLGSGVVDRLKELFRDKLMSVKVYGYNNGSRARDERFKNFGAESYFALRERFQSENISLPEDELLAAELSTRRYSFTSDGRLALESKDEFKRRLGRSPDRADSLVLAFLPEIKIGLPDLPVVSSYWR